MTDHADLIARLRKAAAYHNGIPPSGALCDEAADALSSPVTEEMVERLAVEQFAQRHAGQYRPPVWEEALEHQRVIWRQCARHDLYIAFGMSKQEALRLTRGPKAIQEIEDAIAVVRRTSGHETYPGHDPAAGLPQPDTAAGVGLRPSVAHREGAPTVEDYDEAIDELRAARKQIADSDWIGGCAVCGDSGHDARQCHHNVLVLARQWSAATHVWQCWHCGFIATNDEEGREHFGQSEEDLPSCREAAIRAEATAKERERCAGRVMDAYNEWWRLVNEHSERFAAWKRGGEEGPMPDSRLGSLPDYIAAAIRGGSHD